MKFLILLLFYLGFFQVYCDDSADSVDENYNKLRQEYLGSKFDENVMKSFEHKKLKDQKLIEKIDTRKSLNQTYPRCNYVVRDDFYICELSIFNEETSADFLIIEGEHLPNFNDSDVAEVQAILQQTVDIPAVICRQFPNLVHLMVILSQLQFVTQNGFAECRNLESLTLYYNLIEEIPSNSFVNSPRLNRIDLSHNNISRLNIGSFNGTSVSFLDLDANAFETFDNLWLAEISQTLEILRLKSNRIREIPPVAFVPFNRLFLLDLSTNQLQNIASNAFTGLSNLVDLRMYQNQLTVLDPEWFRTLENLENLRLEVNQIESLPVGVFWGNNKLQYLGITENKLQIIDSQSFGNLDHLIGLYMEFNSIFAIDEEVYDRAVNMINLFLYSNNCTSVLFTNVHLSREQVRNVLRPCFDNFVPTPDSIECNYKNVENIGYVCELSIYNPDGNEFDEISGEHVENFGNSDVARIEAFMEITANLPSVICRQFTNLTGIYIAMSRIDHLTSAAFEHCGRLDFMILEFNRITILPDDVFATVPNLAILSFFANQIEEIQPRAFVGTSLFHLNLDLNKLTAINPAWFEGPHADTLQYLLMDGNFIENLQDNVFASLQNLTNLFLLDNQFQNVSAAAFSGLGNLQLLNLNNCQLRSLQTQWFDDLSSLQRIYLNGNQLTELPEGVFGSQTHIHVSNNSISTVNSNSFRNLNTLVQFNAQNNQINEVDQILFEDAQSLTTLQLANNLCASVNIFNLPINREFYREALETCFENFRIENFGFIECDFEEAEIVGYTCILTVHNPRGNDNFELIEGEHVGDLSDQDVLYVEAYRQQSTIVPSIICHQFTNLQTLYFGFSGVGELTASSFENCHNLEYLNVESNALRNIPGQLFSNAANLATLIFDNNVITEINDSAFDGIGISTLMLEGNRLDNFNINWFNSINETMQVLSIWNNDFEVLPENSFSSLRNLRELNIGNNYYYDLPDGLFHGLSNLRSLNMAQGIFRILKTSWFDELTSLESLFLNYNMIFSIPSGIFQNCPELFEINLNGNQLSVLSSEVFGNLSSLLYISAVYNRITLIDPRLFDDSPNLYNLFLFGNLCVDDNFISIVNNRDSVRNELQSCFNNFDQDGVIECNYMEGTDLPYICRLTIQNILGRDNFEMIGGEHIGNLGDSDVRSVEGAGQHTVNIPSIFCRRFENLRNLNLILSEIEVLTPAAFENCWNLEFVELQFNNIKVIPDFLFPSSPLVSFFDVYFNEILDIKPRAFDGTGLIFLDIGVNRLRAVDPSWFNGSHVDDLMYLFMDSNSFRVVPENSFLRLGNLSELQLGYNPLGSLLEHTFAGLTNLRTLNLNGCMLNIVESQWFDDLLNLRQLYMSRNALSDFPAGIFGSLTHIHVGFNNLETINSNLFRNLSSLVQFNAIDNLINAIDPDFFDNSVSLSSLQLQRNLCTSLNFENLQVNREVYRPLLEQCFENFLDGNKMFK